MQTIRKFLAVAALAAASMFVVSGLMAAPLDLSPDPAYHQVDTLDLSACALSAVDFCAIDVAPADTVAAVAPDEDEPIAANCPVSLTHGDLIGNLIKRYDPGWCLT